MILGHIVGSCMLEHLSEQANTLTEGHKALLLEKLERTESGDAPSVPSVEVLASICGAKLPFAGKYDDYLCHRKPMPNGRCRYHGGTSLGGVNASKFRHGRYSKYIPEGLQETYENAQSDVDLTALGAEIGLLTVRISALLEKLENSDAPSWELVLTKWGGFVNSLPAGYEKELEEIRNLICQGMAASVEEKQTWQEIREVIQEKTRTSGAEWSRLRDLQCLVHIDNVMVMWRGVLEALRMNITDQTMLKAVTADVLRFMPAPTVQSSRS